MKNINFKGNTKYKNQIVGLKGIESSWDKEFECCRKYHPELLLKSSPSSELSYYDAINIVLESRNAVNLCRKYNTEELLWIYKAITYSVRFESPNLPNNDMEIAYNIFKYANSLPFFNGISSKAISKTINLDDVEKIIEKYTRHQPVFIIRYNNRDSDEYLVKYNLYSSYCINIKISYHWEIGFKIFIKIEDEYAQKDIISPYSIEELRLALIKYLNETYSQEELESVELD